MTKSIAILTGLACLLLVGCGGGGGGTASPAVTSGVGDAGGAGNAGTSAPGQVALAFDPATQSFTGAPLANTQDIVILRSQFANNRTFNLQYDGNIQVAGGGSAVQAPARVWLTPFDPRTEVLVGANAITPELRGSGTINVNSSVDVAVFSGALTGARGVPGQSQSFNGRYDMVFEQPGIGNDPLRAVPRRVGLAINGAQTNVQGAQSRQINVQGGGVLTRSPLTVGGLTAP